MIIETQAVPVVFEAFPVLRCDLCGNDTPHRDMDAVRVMGYVVVEESPYLVCAVCFKEKT